MVMQGQISRVQDLSEDWTYAVNNCCQISSKGIFVYVFPQKVILGCNHDFGSGATCN